MEASANRQYLQVFLVEDAAVVRRRIATAFTGMSSALVKQRADTAR
ncbi:hypothetical protein [Paraburkholderia guartelaensis]|jgi:hypothetical protein|nr:hypothetical protein [Paraburkholderia guartelaensis]